MVTIKGREVGYTVKDGQGFLELKEVSKFFPGQLKDFDLETIAGVRKLRKKLQGSFHTSPFYPNNKDNKDNNYIALRLVNSLLTGYNSDKDVIKDLERISHMSTVTDKVKQSVTMKGREVGYIVKEGQRYLELKTVSQFFPGRFKDFDFETVEGVRKFRTKLGHYLYTSSFYPWIAADNENYMALWLVGEVLKRYGSDKYVLKELVIISCMKIKPTVTDAKKDNTIENMKGLMETSLKSGADIKKYHVRTNKKRNEVR